MSDYIEDTGKTSDNPADYNKRDFTPQGCIGSIACKKCGAILWAKGTHCFCMGIYTCPRCGYESKGWIHNIRGFKNGSPIYDDPVDIDSETFEKIKTGFKAVDFAPTGVMIDQLKELSQKDRNKVLRHFCRGCNRYLEEGEVCYCEKY